MSTLVNNHHSITTQTRNLRLLFLHLVILAVCLGSSSLTAQVTNLQNNVPVTVTGAQGSQTRYTYTVPAGATNVSIKTSGGTGDADLYVKFGAAPSENDWECRPYTVGNTEACELAPQAGTYHIMLNAFAAYDGLTITATHALPTPPIVTPPTGGEQLQNNVPITVTGAQGSQTQYTYTVPARATNVSIKTSGGTGDADLYVKFGAAPSENDWECRPYLEGNTETCDFNAPQAGTYYIMLNAFAAYSNLTVTATHALSTPPVVTPPVVTPQPADLQTQALARHNIYRAEVGVPGLTWSNALAADARVWADRLAAEGAFYHSTGAQRPGQGENLAAATTGSKNYHANGRNVGS